MENDLPPKIKIHPSRYLLNWRILVVVLFCVGLNYLLSFLASLQSTVPIYLDTIGTILCSTIVGPLPGIVVGVSNNLINCIIDPTSIYYASLSILVAFLSAHLAKKGYLKKWYGCLFATMAFAIVCGGLGGVLTYTLNGEIVGAGVAGKWATAFNDGGIDAFWAEVTASLLSDLIDKAFTMLIAYLCLRFYPSKWLLYFPEGPLSVSNSHPKKDTRIEMESAKRHFHFSIKNRIIATTLTASVLISAVISTAFAYIYSNRCRENYAAIAYDYATLVTKRVDGDKIATWLATKDASDPDYAATEADLASYLSSAKEMKYLYVYHIKNTTYEVVFDIDPSGDRLGDEFEFDEDFVALADELHAGKEITNLENHGRFGALITAYLPIFDSNQNCVAYVGVDVSIDAIQTGIALELAKALSLELSFIIIAISIASYIAEIRIIDPTLALAKQSENYRKIGSERWLESPEWLNRDHIETHDELESLYRSICEAEIKNSEDYQKIKEQDTTILKMERNIVYALADMVESRDQNTGDHIRRTSLYVKMIATELLKEGKFPETINENYIHDLVLAAPLHDIGKIKIPDSILNKPGKLTDEEFSIMKNHVREGAKILDNATEGMLSEGYISLAKEVAEFHHECFNGKGYLKGLKGEEIPLSARIMALADVFDALVSKRSYKEPFPFDKAVSIIKEERGSHFDPVVTDALLNILPEVRKTLND